MLCLLFQPSRQLSPFPVLSEDSQGLKRPQVQGSLSLITSVRRPWSRARAPVTCSGFTDMDGNDLLTYWPALGECEAAPCALQAWGSERRLGVHTDKDAANNNQPDLALTSGDETSMGRAQRQRKGMTFPGPSPWL